MAARGYSISADGSGDGSINVFQQGVLLSFRWVPEAGQPGGLNLTVTDPTFDVGDLVNLTGNTSDTVNPTVAEQVANGDATAGATRSKHGLAGQPLLCTVTGATPNVKAGTLYVLTI
jgi:hypothetical protein